MPRRATTGHDGNGAECRDGAATDGFARCGHRDARARRPPCREPRDAWPRGKPERAWLACRRPADARHARSRRGQALGAQCPAAPSGAQRPEPRRRIGKAALSVARPEGFEPPTPRFVAWYSDPTELRARAPIITQALPATLWRRRLGAVLPACGRSPACVQSPARAPRHGVRMPSCRGRSALLSLAVAGMPGRSAPLPCVIIPGDAWFSGK